MNEDVIDVEVGHPVLKLETSEKPYSLYDMAEDIADLLEAIIENVENTIE